MSGRTFDWALALVLLVLSAAEIVIQGLEPRGVAMLTATAACISLAYRRVYPLVTVVACIGTQAVNVWAGVPIDEPTVPLLWIFIAMYSVARYSTLRNALIGLAVALGIFAATILTYPSDVVFGLAVLGAPWLAGRALLERSDKAADLAQHIVTLKGDQESRELEAVQAERVRIARDLHDTIAHAVSVMVVQAGAAGEVVATDPSAARRSMETVQRVGQQALAEMAALVGLLRDAEPGRSPDPQPGLGTLHSLADEARAAGLDVDLVSHGSMRDVAPGVQLGAYRVVQEALTNVRRHSEATSATVTITRSS